MLPEILKYVCKTWQKRSAPAGKLFETVRKNEMVFLVRIRVLYVSGPAIAKTFLPVS
jgi:hypothetical protein